MATNSQVYGVLLERFLRDLWARSIKGWVSEETKEQVRDKFCCFVPSLLAFFNIQDLQILPSTETIQICTFISCVMLLVNFSKLFFVIVRRKSCAAFKFSDYSVIILAHSIFHGGDCNHHFFFYSHYFWSDGDLELFNLFILFLSIA